MLLLIFDANYIFEITSTALSRTSKNPFPRNCRINVEVLSVVAQQILSILTALSQRLTRFIFEGAYIALIHTCGIFITMNPGYAGRTELPDNLKSMFRPISMMVPDSGMIAEINLFGEGFQNTRVLAKKVTHKITTNLYSC